MNGSRRRLILSGVVVLAWLSQPVPNDWLLADKPEKCRSTIRFWAGNWGRRQLLQGDNDDQQTDYLS